MEGWGGRGRDGRERREKGVRRDAGYSEELGGLLHDLQQWNRSGPKHCYMTCPPYPVNNELSSKVG